MHYNGDIISLNLSNLHVKLVYWPGGGFVALYLIASVRCKATINVIERSRELLANCANCRCCMAEQMCFCAVIIGSFL